MKDVEIIGMLKAYIKASLVGVGALKGAPCQCVITENADGTHKVTMKWVDDNNVTHTDSFDVLNGQVGEFADISDVSLTNLADGQVVAYNSTTQKWENVANSATVNTLNSVGDVTITTVQDGQALVWSDILSQWVNKDVGITIDNALSSTSENPVQNKVLYLALEDKANKATTLSGYGIADAYTKTETDAAITAEIEKLDVSDSAVAGSYVTAVSEADGKISVTREAADVTPTANSTKMLTSGGAKAALDDKADKVSNATNGNFAGLDSNGNLTDSGKKASDFQTALTFDDEPTENSNNPVKSNGLYVANRNIYEVMGELGAKNLLPYDIQEIKAQNTAGTWNGNTYTPNNSSLNITLNTDGSITVDGTSSSAATATLYLYGNASEAKENIFKGMIASGCPSGGATNKYSLAIQGFSTATPSGGNSYHDIGEGVTVGNDNYARAYVRIQNNITVSNLTFKPMIRLASDTDSTYQPYAKTNRELTSEQGYCTEDQYTAIQTLLS